MKQTLWRFYGIFMCVSIAHASPPAAELSVNGEFKSPQCTIQSPNNGEYDIGKVSDKAKLDGRNLSGMTQTWRVICDTDMMMHVTPTDNRVGKDRVADPERFGLWAGDGIGTVGFYYLEFTDASVDGAPAKMQMADSTMGRAQTGRSLTWIKENGEPANGKVFSVNITVLPQISGLNVMKEERTEKVNFGGSVTLSFNYGV
ncbi:hypothetical protein I5L25_22400 [Serratia marcescens]|nr:hypothetical protein [Serratia marcescens]